MGESSLVGFLSALWDDEKRQEAGNWWSDEIFWVMKTKRKGNATNNQKEGIFGMIFWESDLPNGHSKYGVEVKANHQHMFAEMTPKIMEVGKTFETCSCIKWMYSPPLHQGVFGDEILAGNVKNWKGCNFYSNLLFHFLSKMFIRIKLESYQSGSREPCLSWQPAVVGSQVVGQLCMPTINWLETKIMRFLFTLNHRNWIVCVCLDMFFLAPPPNWVYHFILKHPS